MFSRYFRDNKDYYNLAIGPYLTVSVHIRRFGLSPRHVLNSVTPTPFRLRFHNNLKAELEAVKMHSPF